MDYVRQLKGYYDNNCLNMADLLMEERVRQVYDCLISKQKYHFIIPLNFCESPIEKMFYLCLLGEQLYSAARIGGEVKIIPQLEVELSGNTYRPDFTMFLATAEKQIKAIIECDGHDFHEKTKEQAREDRKRERLFVRHGYKVLRYTGQEIYENPFRCADEVFKTLEMLVVIKCRDGSLFTESY